MPRPYPGAMSAATDGFVRPQIASQTFHPGGRVETERAPAVWTLAHRGYSGSGRLDIWVYRTKQLALEAGATLAMECGLDEDPHAQTLFQTRRYQAVLDRYEETSPDSHLLRVQLAFLQPE